MAHIHWQNKEHPQALADWVQVYRIAKPINLAEILTALHNLPEQLGFEGGLDFWENLLKKLITGLNLLTEIDDSMKTENAFSKPSHREVRSDLHQLAHN